MNPADEQAVQDRARRVGDGDKAAAPFAPRDLIYAAESRCDCGAGLAYPRGMGPRGWWDCGAILCGVADKAAKHTAQLPFTFWKVRSEAQPSARGLTTRPRDEPEPPLPSAA